MNLAVCGLPPADASEVSSTSPLRVSIVDPNLMSSPARSGVHCVGRVGQTSTVPRTGSTTTLWRNSGVGSGVGVGVGVWTGGAGVGVCTGGWGTGSGAGGPESIGGATAPCWKAPASHALVGRGALRWSTAAAQVATIAFAACAGSIVSTSVSPPWSLSSAPRPIVPTSEKLQPVTSVTFEPATASAKVPPPAQLAPPVLLATIEPLTNTVSPVV